MDKKEITSKQAVSKLTAKFAGYGVFILALYKIIETLLHKTIFNSLETIK